MKKLRSCGYDSYVIAILLFFIVLSLFAKAYTYAFVFGYMTLLIWFTKRRKAKWTDVTDRLLDFALLVVAGSPAIVYILLVSIDGLIKAYPQYVIVQGEKGDWIGFAGALIGGALTLIAIIFTFQFEKEKNEKESITKLRPYVVCESITESLIPTFANEFRFNLVFRNLGITPAREFKLQKDESCVNVNQECVSKSIFVERIDFLEASKDISCSCSIDHYPIELSEEYHFHMYLDFLYSDLPAEHHYIHNVRIDGMLYVDHENSYRIDIESAGVINEFVWEEKVK